MARTITWRLSDGADDAVRRWADADTRSMNAWIEQVLDIEDMRRRCADHEQFLAAGPDAVAFAEAWADRSAGELSER